MHESKSLPQLIRAYVLSRRGPEISVSSAARAISQFLPELGLSLRELDNAIAACALAEGYAVLFDRSPET
jgi:hypothetical protein